MHEKIITRMVKVEGGLWYRATYASDDDRYGARAYASSAEEAVRILQQEFPDDGAVILD
jgi:hypothetical protein